MHSRKQASTWPVRQTELKEKGVERGGVAALHEHSVAAACEETIHEVRMGEHYTEYIYLGKHNLQVCWY